MIIIERMEPEDREVLETLMLGSYLDGQCYELAVALNEELGWPLYGLWTERTIRHAFVKDPEREDRFVDARGRVSSADIFAQFGRDPKAHIEAITKIDLVRTRPVDPLSVQSVKRTAETLWPDLPWKRPRHTRFKTFAEELEALCRKHRIFLREAYPASPIMAYPSEGDEAGFRLRPLGNGETYGIWRQYDST